MGEIWAKGYKISISWISKIWGSIVCYVDDNNTVLYAWDVLRIALKCSQHTHGKLFEMMNILVSLIVVITSQHTYM
jgi:hypothetical protein